MIECNPGKEDADEISYFFSDKKVLVAGSSSSGLLINTKSKSHDSRERFLFRFRAEQGTAVSRVSFQGIYTVKQKESKGYRRKTGKKSSREFSSVSRVTQKERMMMSKKRDQAVTSVFPTRRGSQDHHFSRLEAGAEPNSLS